MAKVIGVFGSAKESPDKGVLEKAKAIGELAAKNGYTLLTGACSGYPYIAARAAKEAGGVTIGISPATNREEHKNLIKYPEDVFTFIAYTGFGLKGRNTINVRSCDIAIFISGGMGTLNEFTAAYDEGKDIGILTDTGGISEIIEQIIEVVNTDYNRKVFFNSDPEELMKKLISC